MEEKKKSDDKNRKFNERDWKWLTGILVSIIILILTFRLGDNLEVINLFSFIASATSIALALVAINISLKQDSDNRVVNENMRSILHGIVSDVGSMKNSVEKLTGKDIDAIAQDTMEEITVDDKQTTYTAEEVKSVVQEAINNFSQNVKTKVENGDNKNSTGHALAHYFNLKKMINDIANEENGEFKNVTYIQKELKSRHGIELSKSQIINLMRGTLGF